MLSATSCIYDDLSHCGNTHTLSYQMIGNATIVPDIIREELATVESEPMKRELEKRLLPMFSDQASRLSLAFYQPDGLLQSQADASPGSDRHTLQILLPPVAHAHIAMAHNAQAYPVEIRGVEEADKLGLYYTDTDTTEVEMTGLFTARATLPAETSADTIRLTMQNTAAAIVLIPLSGKPLGEAAMFVRETAGGYSCADSLFLFDQTPVLRGKRANAGGLTAFYSAAFPSRDKQATDPPTTEKGTWEVDIYIHTGESITKNTLHINRPLQAGIPQVLSFTVDDRGEIEPSQEATVSVELDWNPGFDFDLDV